MLDGLYRLQGLYLVALSYGQPVALHGILLGRLGIILSMPHGDVQPQHAAFVAGCLNRERIADRASEGGWPPRSGRPKRQNSRYR